MKLLHKILGVGTLGLVLALPLVGQTPVWAELTQTRQVIAQAAEESAVKLNLAVAKQSIVATTEGEKIEWNSLDDGATVQPGDTLRYTVTGNNTGADSAKDLVITQPIPERMVYKLETATSQNEATVTYSTDNGETFVAKPMIEVVNEEGETVEKPAPAETYTHIRWQFEALAPAAEAMAMYDVEVQQVQFLAIGNWRVDEMYATQFCSRYASTQNQYDVIRLSRGSATKY